MSIEGEPLLNHYICESKNHAKLQTVEQKKELSTRVFVKGKAK